MGPESVAEGSEQQGRRFTRDARDGEQHPGDDSLERGLDHDAQDDFPARDAQGQRRLPIAVRDEQQHLLGRANDQRNHHEAQRDTARIGRETFHRHNDQGIRHDAPDNRRHTVEHVGAKPNPPVRPLAAVFGQVHASEHADGHTDQRSQPEQRQRPGNRIGHPAPDFADGFGQLRQKAPIDGAGSRLDEVEQNQCQWCDDHDGAPERQDGHAEVLHLPPRMIGRNRVHGQGLIERHDWFSGPRSTRSAIAPGCW